MSLYTLLVYVRTSMIFPIEGRRLLPKNFALSTIPPPTSLPEDMLSKKSLN